MAQKSPRFVSRFARSTVALILARGRGSRLGHVTERRCKPAVPFGGKSRIIDFTLSNCVTSGIRRIGISTEHKARYLGVRMQRGRGFLRGDFADNPLRRCTEQPDPSACIPGRRGLRRLSLGIYVVDFAFHSEQPVKDAGNSASSQDFVEDAIPCAVPGGWVIANPLRDEPSGDRAYWGHVGTIDALLEAKLEFIGVTPPLDLYDDRSPIWTPQERLPPAKFVFEDKVRRCEAVVSMVAGGCVANRAIVRDFLPFSNVRSNSYADIQDSVIMPDGDVGRNCNIRRCILDRGCRLPERSTLGIDPRADAEQGFYVSNGGVILVVPEMLGQKVTYVR